jgi:hypothetical protein
MMTALLRSRSFAASSNPMPLVPPVIRIVLPVTFINAPRYVIVTKNVYLSIVDKLTIIVKT